MKTAGAGRIFRTIRGTVVCALALALSATHTTGWAKTAGSEPGGDEAQDELSVMLVLDASGSMAADDAGGGSTRMEAARAALTGAVDNLPDDARVGLRVYGATESNKEKTEAACTDTQVAVPLGPADPDALATAVAEVEPSGFTPISHALTQAADDLGDADNRHIILVSDGEETCDPDPCETVEQLTEDGIAVQIDTVGYGVEAAAQGQLRCLAETTGGTYLDAPDAGSLEVALDKLSTRALRGFSVQGTPVEGVGRDDTDEAPVLDPGQYTDSIMTGTDEAEYYTLRPAAPGHSLQLSVTSRPPSTGAWLDKEIFSLTVTDRDGDSCGYESNFRFHDLGISGAVTTVLGVDQDCLGTGEDLLLEVERDGDGSRPAPVELIVREVPLAEDPDALPEGVVEESSVPEELAPREAPAEPVVGGTSFTDAAALEPGTYVEHLIPGEQVFYSTTVGWGQSAQLVVEGPTDDSYLSEEANDYLWVRAEMHEPDRRAIYNPNSDAYASYHLGSPPERYAVVVPEVRYRNALDSYPSEARYVNEAGTYYFTLAVPPDYQGNAQGRPVPVEFTLAVDGEVSGVPTFPEGSAAAATESEGAEESEDPEAATAAARDAGSTATSTPGASAADGAVDEGGSSPLWWVAGGALAVLLAAVGGLWALSNRGRTQNG